MTSTLRICFLLMGCLSFIVMEGQNLEDHKCENRILIVKTSDIQSKKYREQLKEFDDAAEALKDRKFVVYHIIGEDFDSVDYTNPALNTSGKTSQVLSSKVFNENLNFEVILVGLDGSIKLQQIEVIKKEALFDIVDAMPMRSSEMRRNKVKN